MSWIQKMKNKNNLPLILFTIVLLNFIPLIIPNAISKESFGVGAFKMALCFGIEIIILLMFYFKNIEINEKVKKNTLILTGISIILFLVQIKNYVIGNFYIMDLFNIACTFINILLLYIAVYDFKIEEKYINNFFNGIIIFGIVSAVFTFVFYYKEILASFGIGNVEVVGYIYKIKGFFSNRNGLAFFCYVAVIANTFMIINNKSVIYKITLVTLLATLFVSYSRTGLALTLMFLILNLFLSDKIKTKNKIIIIVSMCILAIIGIIFINVYMPGFLLDKVLRIWEIKNLSGRTDIWQVGIELLTQNIGNIIFGLGRFNSIQSLLVFEEKFTQFHNVYLDILLTGGILELAYIIFIFATVIRKILKSEIDKVYKTTYIAMYLTYALYIMMESDGRFSIGCVDTLCLIFFVTIPLLHANSYKEENNGNKE